MPTELSVGDPVFLERASVAACSADSPASAASTNSTLEGVVAYLGQTDFAPGGDWVGVRLTGTSSRGRGRNDGKVKGKRYFVCDEKCGMFVRRSAITKRSLNRIEELRLRREIGSALLASSSPAPDTEQKQMVTTPTRGHRQSSSLQRALSSKRGQIGIGKRGIESPSHFRTPPPPSPPHKTHQSTTGADRQKVESSTNANSSTRKSRLDEIRQRKKALASTTNRDTTASHSPLTTTASITAAETLSLSGGTFSAEDERNRLAGELSALRGELFALRDENESLRRSLDSRNGGVLASADSAPPHTNRMVLLDSSAKPTGRDNHSTCLDSLDEVLEDGVRHQQQVTSKATTKAHRAGFADLSLLDDIETPAKPDLERRLAKALLKIALLSEELEDLRESKQSGDERTFRGQGEEVLIPLDLEKIRDECPHVMPASLPLALQGIIATSDWALFARDIEDEIHRWAKTKRRIPKNAAFGTFAASISLAFFFFSLFVAAALSIVTATLLLAASCRNFYLSRRCRRKLDILLQEYREKWPGTVIQLSKSKDPKRWCGARSPCACTNYSLRIASDFDIEQLQGGFGSDRNEISSTSCRSTGTGTHGDRRRGGGGHACNGDELPHDLEEPLLPFVSS